MSKSAATLQDKRARLRELHAQGLSAAKIAKQLGVHTSTVSRWAKAEGLSFDRSKTAEATAAKAIDLAAGRQRLAEKMLSRAEEALDDLDKPYTVFSFGVRDNVYREHKLDRPPVEVKRNVLTMAGITFDKLSRIVEQNPDVTGAESAVRALQAGLTAAASALRSPEETPLEE